MIIFCYFLLFFKLKAYGCSYLFSLGCRVCLPLNVPQSFSSLVSAIESPCASSFHCVYVTQVYWAHQMCSLIIYIKFIMILSHFISFILFSLWNTHYTYFVFFHISPYVTELYFLPLCSLCTSFCKFLITASSDSLTFVSIH